MTSKEGNGKELCPKPPSSFVREATGLVRSWSWSDALLYNFMGTAPLSSFVTLLFFVTTPATFPGGNLILALLIGFIICVPGLLAFGLLTAAMPRSGGDYVFQSRIIHPAIAFMLIFSGWVIWVLNYNAYAALGFVSLILYPMLSLLGATTGNAGLLGAAAWTLTTTGTVIIAILALLLGFVVLMRGMRVLSKLMIAVMIGQIIAWFMLIAIFATNSPSSFAPAFNNYMHTIGSNATYESVITSAQAAGTNVSPPFSWTSTIGVVPLVYLLIVWAFASTYVSGEIRKGKEFSTYAKGMIGAMAVDVVMLAVVTYLYIPMIGYTFWNAIGYQYSTGASVASILPTVPSYTLFPMILVPNPAVIVVFYVLLGLYLPLSMIVNWLPASRILLAMSFDRLLPSKMADVHEKYHVPHYTIIVGLIGSLIWFVLVEFTTAGTWLYSMVSISDIIIMVTCLAAVIFPYRSTSKKIFEGSSIAGMKVAGIPAVTIAGILGFVANGWILYYLIANPAYGAWNWPTGAIVNGAIFVVCLAGYFAAKYYRKRQGIDIGYAFKEIPPE